MKFALALTLLFTTRSSLAADQWPPVLPNAVDGTVRLKSAAFVEVPEPPPQTGRKIVETEKPGAYDVAKTPPVVDLAFHGDLGPDAIGRRLWSSWGDIGVARDGTVYAAIGDHGNAVGGDARAFLYRWDPTKRRLERVVDFNAVAPRKEGQPAWSKVHAKIDEGPDGRIYTTCTLNDGNRAKNEEYHWSDEFPGGQIYAHDPRSGETTVFASLPPRRCTATSLLDRKRGVWWCNLEAGEGDALWALDLKTRKLIGRTSDGAVSFNRAFGLLDDGSILFNAEQGLATFNPESGKIAPRKASFPDSPGMRCVTRPTQEGHVFGVTHKTNQIYRYDTKADRVTLLGPAWATAGYTTVMVLSPDERYLYYLPGAHGQAWRFGTPVVQYDIARGRRKVLAFLAPVFEQECDYVPGGTYGVKLSPAGDVLYANLNGHASERTRPESMKPIGFGLCSFAAIHIPAAERE